MKKVILLLLFIPGSLFGQVNENFESATISKWIQSVSGHWSADTAGSLSGRYSLHHVFDNPISGNDQAGIPVTGLEPSMGTTSWTFKLKHGYDPSSSNNWGVFLLSDSEPASMIPGGTVNGFVIGVNLTGYDDTLRLWKIKNGSLSEVLNTGINWQSDIGAASYASLNIERTAGGRWKTRIDSEKGALIDTASVIHKELFDAEWFGIYYEYSSTRDRLLWIDDISIGGVFYDDREAPSVIKCTANTLYSVELILNEEASAEFFTPSNFSIEGISPASSVSKLSPFSARIRFGSCFRNKSENGLIIKSLCDKSGNCNQSVTIGFIPIIAEPGDVVISEIMADPIPSVSLPEKEYLEILNNCTFAFNLKNWKLNTDGQASVFPETVIYPHEQMILCQIQDTSLFLTYGRVTGLKSFPALTDGGRLLILSDSGGRMIHGVRYSSDWYSDNLKKEGGWSLEMTDTKFPFFFNGNWTSSVSRSGGTPGIINSVYHSNPDLSFKGIVNAFPVDSMNLRIIFSEPVKNFTENLSGIRINDSPVESLTLIDQLMTEFSLKPVSPFKRNRQYSFAIPMSITDFAANSPEVKSWIFGLTEIPAKGDMVFNEILFNPLPGDADFIELFNASGKIIDASELFLVSVNESGTRSSPVSLSDDNRCILPGQYFAVTTDRESLLTRYFSSCEENIFQISQLPSMADDEGHLILLNRQFESIDEVSYAEKMHYSLLSGYEGISLEKVRPSVPSSDQKNWHSASESSGWATPGAQNSVYSVESLSEETITLSSTRITPDNDGYEDLLVIDLKFKGNGNIVTITIFDETGAYICRPAGNLLAGNKASVTWDGTADDGSIVNPGIYIILISIYDDTGKTEKWKRVCAVIR